MEMSVPESTNVAVPAAAQIATKPVRSHCCRGTASRAFAASGVIAGLASHSSAAAPTPNISTPKSTQDVGQVVAANTPATGPIMNATSTSTPSRASAARRSSSGTAASTACRMIEKLGTANSPAMADSPNSGQ
jgi:hypothetical protein